MTLREELESMAERHGICLFALAYVQSVPDDNGDLVEVFANVQASDCMGVKRKTMKKLRKAINKAFVKRVDKIMSER